MKNTIEEIRVVKTFYKYGRDIYGNRTREPYQREVKRKVQLVTGWLRFGHYFIDGLIIGGILFGVNYFIAINPVVEYSAGFGVNDYYYSFIPSIDQIIVTVGYYFICELTLQRTIGKYATNSVVINEYAEKPDSGSLIGRSFSRLVPFEAFSCLGDRGWHDKWSGTYVVTVKERNTLKRLLAEQRGEFISDSDEILD